MNTAVVEIAIIWCGFGHFAICLASLTIPKVLNWSVHLSTLHPLLRQMFWTYAGYILAINFCFGLISILGSHELVNQSFLAKATTLLIGTYWLTRIAIQFLYFDRSDAPKGILFTLGEIALVGLFTLFTLTYFTAFFINQGWI